MITQSEARAVELLNSQLSKLPVELHAALERLPITPRYALAETLVKLKMFGKSKRGLLPYEYGLAIGMILASQQRDELNLAESGALHDFVQGLIE